jgi:glycosyltransferase involved in cell wall biosynthesis
LLRLGPRPEARPNGISAIVRVRGEAEWIEPCLRSVREFADEILVLDNGAGATTAGRLSALARELGARLRCHACPDLDVVALSNRALDLARQRWVIRWDADLVAHTSGPGDIRHLREYLLGLDPRRSYMVSLAAAELAGDLAHQFADRRVRTDGLVHSAHRAARFVRFEVDIPPAAQSFSDRVLRGGRPYCIAMEALRTPVYYRALRWDRVSYVHVDVKPGHQLVRRHFWLEWLRAADPARYPTLDAYVLAQVRDRWGVPDLDTAVAAFMARYCEGLVPYDPVASGPWPELLRPYLATSRYRVEYRDGRITGRREG